MLKITCPHFKDCGGCALLNLSYEEQVAHKQAKLKETLKDFWTQDIPLHGRSRNISAIKWNSVFAAR